MKGDFVVIERDNRTGDFGQIKRLAYFRDRALKDNVVTRAEKKVYDLLPDLNATTAGSPTSRRALP